MSTRGVFVAVLSALLVLLLLVGGGIFVFKALRVHDCTSATTETYQYDC